jgi:hypothetical protein
MEKYIVTLSAEEREQLEAIVSKGSHQSRKIIKRAHSAELRRIFGARASLDTRGCWGVARERAKDRPGEEAFR